MPDEEDYDSKLERLEAENGEIIDRFLHHTVEIKKQGKRRMHRAADNLRFFANEYLLAYEDENLLEGLSSFQFFVSDWFIRKCMWSDEKSVRENLAAYDAFVTYLKETEQLREGEEQSHLIPEEKRNLYELRAKYYNHPAVELEEILNEFGMWDDEAIRNLEKHG